MCVYTYIYIYIERERDRERDTYYHHNFSICTSGSEGRWFKGHTEITEANKGTLTLRTNP